MPVVEGRLGKEGKKVNLTDQPKQWSKRHNMQDKAMVKQLLVPVLSKYPCTQ